MKCTSCKQGTLRPAYLDGLFASHTCDHCDGNWIYLSDYLAWLDKEGAEINLDDSDISVNADESKRALLCPKTGTLMLKYRIAKDTDHKLDLSPSVNGIWLDKGEWELLKQSGLAKQLNKIFTAPWQRQIKESRAQDVFKELYKKEFGEENYEKILAFREWLEKQEKKAAMLAYLAADDPYAANR